MMTKQNIMLFLAFLAVCLGGTGCMACSKASMKWTGRKEVRFKDMCGARGYAHMRIGVVDTEIGALDFQGHFSLPLSELKEAYEGTLPKHFG